MTDMHLGSWLRWFVTLMLVATDVLSLAAWAGSLPSITSPSSIISASANALPRNVILPLGAVNQVFPQITEQVSAGSNPTATGNPIATRSAIYATADRLRKMTISVDRYDSSNCTARGC